MGRADRNGHALRPVRWSKRGASDTSVSIEGRESGSHSSPEAGCLRKSVQAVRDVDPVDGSSTRWVSGSFATDRRTLRR